ncbi:MAG: prepilin-type N-terminal cleavage/methylation domain-containing protein [Lautropia sp.]
MTARVAMPAGKFTGKRLPSRHPTGRSRGGFTLIELLVACGLMAVLALLSWRGLDSVLQTRERLVVASDELRSLTLAFSQMDEDLLRSWPVNQLKLNEPQLRVEVSGENNAQSLYLIREANRTGFPTRVQRVIYQVRDGQLARGFSPYGRAALNDGAAVGGGSVQAIVWQPILGGVRSISLRGWVDNRGWLDAVNLAGVAKAAASANATATGGATGAPNLGALIAAQAAARAAAEQLAVGGIEVVLERMDGQRFLRVFSVKD